jgi:AcrR family transcriptional regulator
MAEVVAERGLRNASKAEVAKRAGVSRAAFSRNFNDLDDCFVALLDWMLARGATAVAGAFQAEASWDDAVLAGLQALLTFLDAEPVCARACLLESMTGLSAGFQSRATALAQLGKLVDASARRQLALERQPPDSAPEAMVASVLGILRRRLLSGEVPPFVTLLDQLAEVVVAPYLGPSAASRVAARGRERTSELLAEQPSEPAPEDIEVPEMLRRASSYRLRACLQYLADNPNASNGSVAEHIGVSHSGQVSMLLDRLHRSDLLLKEGGGAGRPNAWRLSPHGAEVLRVLLRRRTSLSRPPRP